MSPVELDFLSTDFFFSPENSEKKIVGSKTKRDSDPYHSSLKKTCSVARAMGIPPLGGTRVMKTPGKKGSRFFFTGFAFFGSFFHHEKYSTDWGCGRSGESRYDCRTREKNYRIENRKNGIRTRIIVAWKKYVFGSTRHRDTPAGRGKSDGNTGEKRISFFTGFAFFWSFFRHEKYSTDWGCGRSGESRYDCRTRIFFDDGFLLLPEKLGKKFVGSKQKNGIRTRIIFLLKKYVFVVCI